ncbi:MAG: hypothetical protein U1C74_19910 [Phenylobacterium sp.]|nr:hypothetical protein [Phenylobacterium sp.]
MRRFLLAATLWTLAAPVLAADWAPPRNAFGHPDLEGAWTNATITPQARPAKFGTRLVMTPDEVREAEGAADAQIERGNQATDPNAPTVEDGRVGGYNRGFLDPGTRVMRVAGQPRTSILTTPDGLSVAIGGIGAGFLFDAAGDYRLVLILGAAQAAVSAVSLLASGFAKGRPVKPAPALNLEPATT